MKSIELKKWPIVSKSNIEAVCAVAQSGNWHYGEVFESLEQAIAERLDRHVVATSSCAWAIYLCLKTLEQKQRVGVPAYTYWGTVHPIVWAGATPVFVDVDPRTFNICAENLKRKLDENCIDCILAVHLFGQPISPEIVDLSEEYGVPLIEDGCQAFGGKQRGQPVGAIGSHAALSFNNRKTLPAGIGGAAIFENFEQAQRARELIEYGAQDPVGSPTECGFYLPISEFDAALARSQLPKLDNWISHSQEMANILSAHMPSRSPFVEPEVTHTWHKYRVYGTVEEEEKLHTAGIPTSRWMKNPMTEIPAYREFVPNPVDFPGAREVAASSFCILDDNYPIVAQDEETVRILGQICQEVLND